MTLAPAGFGTQPFGSSYLGVGLRDVTLTVGTPRHRTVTATLGGPVNLSRIERRFETIPIALAADDGTALALPAAVDIAALPPRTTPDVDTAWTQLTPADGAVTVLLAGPDADPDGALPVPATGADLWVRVTDTPEILPAKVGRVTVT